MSRGQTQLTQSPSAWLFAAVSPYPFLVFICITASVLLFAALLLATLHSFVVRPVLGRFFQSFPRDAAASAERNTPVRFFKATLSHVITILGYLLLAPANGIRHNNAVFGFPWLPEPTVYGPMSRRDAAWLTPRCPRPAGFVDEALSPRARLKNGLSPDYDYLNALVEQDSVASLRYGVLFLLALSSLGVYSIILAG